MSEIAELLVSAGWEGQDAEAGLERLGQKFDKTVGRLRDAQGRFTAAADGQRKAAQASREWADGLDGLNGGLGRNIQQMLAMAGIAATVAGAVTFIVSAGTRTENSLNTLQSVTRATGEEMKRVSALARELGNDVSLPGTSAADAADAMVELAKGGLTLQESMEAARGTIQLARAATIEEAKAATITADALNTFGLAGRDAGKVADLLAGSANASSGEITDMAQALAQAGAVAKGANVSIQDTVTAISLLAKNGVKGSDAGTSLKTFLLALQAPNSKEAVETLRSLNIEAYDAATKTFKPLPGLIGEFQSALAKLNDEAKAKALVDIFGTDAIRAARILFGEGTAGFEQMSAAVTRAGQAAEIAAAKSKGLSGAWDALKSTVETFAIDVYGLVSGPLAALLQTIASYPGLFTAAAVAVGGLILAHKLYNSELLITTATRIPAMLASLRNTIVVMTSFSQVTAMSATALATFALGWGAVLVAVGIAAYALIDWSTATERAAAVTKDSAASLAEQHSAMVLAAASAHEMAGKQSLNAEEHKKLDLLLGNLNPTTQAYIKTLGDEKTAVEALDKAIGEKLASSTQELEAKLRLFGNAVVEGDKKTQHAEFVFKNYGDEIQRLQQEVTKGRISQEEAAAQIDRWSNLIGVVRQQLDGEYTPALAANTEKLLLTANALHLTREALEAKLKALAYNEAEIKVILGQYDSMIAKQSGVAASLNQTTNATNAQAQALANLSAIMARFNDRDQGITARVMSIVDQAKSKGEAVRMAKEAMKNDRGFAFDVQGSIADKAEKEAVEQAIGITKPSGGGGKRGGGGGGRGDSAANRAGRFALESAQIDLREAESIYSQGVSIARRFLDQNLTDYASYVAQLRTLEQDRYAAVQEGFKAEEKAASGMRGRERENKLKDIHQRERAAEREHGERMAQITADAGAHNFDVKQRFAAATAAMMAARQQVADNDLARLVEAGTKTNVQAVQERFEALTKAAEAEGQVFQNTLVRALGGDGALDGLGAEAAAELRELISTTVNDALNAADSEKLAGEFTQLLSAASNKEAMQEALNALLEYFLKRKLAFQQNNKDTKDATDTDLSNLQAYARRLGDITNAITDLERESQADRIRIMEGAGVRREQVWKRQLAFDQQGERIALQRRVTELQRQRDFVARTEQDEKRKAELVAAYDAQIEAERERSGQRQANILEDYYKKQDDRLRSYVDKAVGVLRSAMDAYREEGWGGFFKSLAQNFRDLLLQMAEDLLKSRLLQLLRNMNKIPAPGSTQGDQQTGSENAGSGGFDFGFVGDFFKRIFNVGDSSKDADAVSAAGEQMKGAIEQGGDKAADKTEKAGDRQAKTLTSVGQSIVSTMLQVAAAVAAGSQGMGFWKGLLFAAASGAISGAFGKWSQGGSGGSGGGGSQEFSGFANPGQTAASGGLLRGPGTPTSDSILGVDPLTQLATAWVSRDEYVIKAASVAKLGVGALDYINQYGELPAASIGGMLSRIRSRIAASQRQQLAAPGMRGLTGGGFEFIPGRAEGGLASDYVPPTASVGGSSVSTDNSRQVTVNVTQHFDTGGKPVSAQTARQAARRMKGAFAQELE